ncbi:MULTISPECIES: hypothetical protein [unclassified Streptomyces]|uniref:hypothetical protein n=1 Tax=unclassified Streptomyces TaxID=2593676 RepID=UPI0016562B0A|nr:hypothetical protein [Streptomyces sp. CB02980]MCB8900962.1 hypothetical protein [Streptomyces sp. CB02980]
MDIKDKTFVNKTLDDKAFADKLMGNKALADELIATLLVDESLVDLDLAKRVMALYAKGGTFHEGMTGLKDRAAHDEDLAEFLQVILVNQSIESERAGREAATKAADAERILNPTNGVYVFTGGTARASTQGLVAAGMTWTTSRGRSATMRSPAWPSPRDGASLSSRLRGSPARGRPSALGATGSEGISTT